MNKDNFFHKLTKYLFWQYVVVTIVMMIFYTGGHRYAPELTYYVLDQNYLSDLGRSVDYAGKENPVYIFYSLTLGIIGVGIFLFFVQTSAKLNIFKKSVILLCGLLSAIGYIGIAVYPADVNLFVHIVYAQSAFFGFFITTVLSQIFMNREKYSTANKLFYILNISLFLYLLLIFFGPSSSQGIWALQLKTIAQKVMVYGQIFICLGILNGFRLSDD
ncbi:MAG: hypothetical protein L3J83_07605 [Proteobacteria bacterium]|nr:hypothetical protein [Pseudomonadota bacterium]